MKSVLFKTFLDFSAKMYPWHLLKHKSKLKKKHSDGNELCSMSSSVVSGYNQSWGCCSAINVCGAEALISVPMMSKAIFLQITAPSKKNTHTK